ncbi:little elongation complex subunit 1 [Pristis pectinata]|uniref:little elongation complex subunit 1 n=1 Tax=Pristis pectinata TaxID=685728 RepID=UPI00223DC2AA|nr:little elongation complex subunit 1 [Pristis pectinata]
MMPGEPRSQAAGTGPGSGDPGSGTATGPCQNCHSLQQNLNEYVAAFIALKQKIIDTDHVLTEYQKKCDELQKTERDRKTLRDQLDESLQKFVPLEKCKEEMDAMRIELEEKRSSIKMYQQTHLEFSKLEQERIKNDALNKKLEMRIKKLEETTTKQSGEIKQLKKEKTTLERNLKKTQEKLLVQQKNGVKVLKDTGTPNSTQDVSRIDKNKVKLLLEEIWMCIEKSNVQEKQSKGSTYSPGKKANSQKKCKIPRSLINPSHSSPVKKELPPSSSLHHLECDQEKNDQSELDECMIDEGLKSNGDSAFYDEKTVEVTRHQDPIDSPNVSSTDTDSEDGDNDEQDALSQQLQEILYWTQPLPPQLSPLPYSSSSGKQSVFGNIMDSSDDDGGSNLPRRSCSESVSETDQPDTSTCTETTTTDQSSLTEAGISENTLETEKMDCTRTETTNMNVQCLAETKTGDEVSYPCLIAEDVECKNENNIKALSLLEETRKDSDMITTPEMQSVDIIAPNGFHEEDLMATQQDHSEGVQGNDTSKDAAVSVVSNLKIVEPQLERSKPNSKNEDRIDTGIKQGDMESLVLQETSSCGQLDMTSEEMEVEEIHYKISTCDSQKNECTVASELVSDREHPKSVDVAKGHTNVSTGEETMSFSQLNSTVVNGAAQDQCIPKEDMEMEEVNCNSFTSDKQHAECTQISLQPTDVELPQAESPLKEQDPKMMETPPHAESYCAVKNGTFQGSFKTFTSTELVMEENNSADSVSRNEKQKLPLNSVLESDVERTCNEFGVEEQSKLEKMQERAPPGDLDCPAETELSQGKSKKNASVENKEIEKIDSSSLISDNQETKSVVASALLNATEDFVAKGQNELDRIQGTTVLVAAESSIIAEGGSKDSVCEGGVLGSTSDNGLAVSSEQKFIQQNQSDLTTKGKDRLNGSAEIVSLEFNGPVATDITQNSSKHNVHIGDMEIDMNAPRSDGPKDECLSALVPFSSQLTQVKSAIMGQDFLDKAQKTSPFVESNSSVSQVVMLDKRNDYSSTDEIEEVTSNRSTPPHCLLSSIQSSTEESQTDSVIKEEDVITKTEETSLLLTEEVPDKSDNKDILCTQSKSVEVTECESPVDKWKEDQLMENKEMEGSEIEERNNHTVKPSGDYLSSDQVSPHFDAVSDESSRPNMSQNIARQHFTHVGQNRTADIPNNTALESEEHSNTEKNKDEPLEKPLPDNGIQQPVQKSCSPSTQICKVNKDPQTHEAGVPVLIRKIKKGKQWHRKSPRPTKETQKAIHRKLDDMDVTTETATPESQKMEFEVQAQNCKTEFGQHCLSVNNHVTIHSVDFPFDSESVSATNETVCNNESITNVVEESTAVHPDCNESKTEQLTLDKQLKQDPCQTPMLNVHSNTNINYEAAGNCDNTMSVECETSDLGNSAQKVCDNKTCSESSPKNDLLGCTQIENKHLAGNDCNQSDPVGLEKSDSFSEICSYQDTNFCTKEHFGIQMNSSRIGISEQMPDCKASMKTVNSYTNTTLEEASIYMPPVQKVDNSTQTELICNGSQVVLFARNNWPATSKTLSQMGIIREDKDKIPKVKSVSSLPDAASDYHRPVRSASIHGKEVLLESTIDGSVNSKSFGTDQTCKSASSRKVHLNRMLPNTLINGDVQQEGSLQKSKIQSTYKRRVALRRRNKGSNPNDLPVIVNTDASTAVLCMQEIHQVMLEMGQPLPPLLPPLVATPPRTIRSTRAQSSPVRTSCVASLCSPVDDLASPSKETSKAASVSPLLDHLQQKSPQMHSPSPLEFARNERIQSSPLQFCTTTPKHAVPVPGRLPPSTSASAGSALPQENSVKILDAMYPNLSARARTLNILRGNVQLSMRGPAEGENQAGPVNQIMGFKAINSSPTAFVKAGSNSRSEGSAKDLEQQKPVDNGTSNAMDTSTQDQKAAKRCAGDDAESRAKKMKTENNCQHDSNTADLITSKESPAVDVVDQTKPLLSDVVEPKPTNKTELLSQPHEPVNTNEEAVASALKKITESCFDLLPVIRSHVFVGNIPQIPVLRDEEKELICELSGNKDLTEALLLAIIKKLKVEQTTLDGNCLQALSRVYVAICRHQGDLERARLLSYSILKEDFPDSSKLLLLILSVWQNIFSMQGPVNKAMQAVAKQRAKGDILNCLSVYLNWEKNPPLDISSLVSSFLVAMQQSPKVRFQTSSEYGMDFNGDMWELIYAIDLLCSQQQWTWTHDCFIRKEVWPVMDKWMKRRKGHRNVLHIQDVTVAGVMRLIGCLGQQGLKKSSIMAVQSIATVINKFLQQAFQEGVPWPVQLSAAYAVYDLAPSNPKGALEAVQKWKASVTEPIPPVANNCLMELETLCEKLNFGKKNNP